jgi:two-component system, NtrC family, nitrogen regulation sensor histidine kinase NtrY
MAPDRKHLKVVMLGAGAFLLLVLLTSLQAWNLPFLQPRSAGLVLLFTLLSVVAFLVFVFLLVLLSRNILKLYADQRSRVLGSRLRSRMLIGALILSLAPALFMFFFSYYLMNRSIDRWFSQPVGQLREDSTRVALELSRYVTGNARAEAEALAHMPSLARALEGDDDPAVLTPTDLNAPLFDAIRSRRITLQGGFVVVYHEGQPVAQFQMPRMDERIIVRPWLNEGEASTATSVEPAATTILKAAQRSDEPVIQIGEGRSGEGQPAPLEYALGTAIVTPSDSENNVVVVGLPMPPGLSSTIARIQQGAEMYWSTYRARNGVRRLGFSILLLLTALILFTSSWLALFLSKQITRPVEALADAMEEIAAGHYKHRLSVDATQELGELIRSFNHMAADLEESRTIAETSTSQLSAANITLEERRRELETVLETIPSGVVTLDSSMRILQANQAFLDLLEPAQQETAVGGLIQSFFQPDLAEDLTRLLRRSQRMGIAAMEFEFRSPRGVLNLSTTMAALELRGHQRGCILVVEDVTEFLRAQRQVAWKEVAQRVAHEIKNPLTPISLSAERIRKHVDHPLPESANVVRRCSEVILGSVETMRKLVDQFAALAQFPTAQPQPNDLNTIVENALLLFAGRLSGITIRRRLAPDIPPVMADAEALKRALANLIDNAAEAMQGSLLRQLTIETCLSENHMGEIVVADTGHGLTAETRERLFLPYFSTKQRGTGLGLSIAAKIIQEHQGAIRAEQNMPQGARFVVELPLVESPALTASGGVATTSGFERNGAPNGHHGNGYSGIGYAASGKPANGNDARSNDMEQDLKRASVEPHILATRDHPSI